MAAREAAGSAPWGEGSGGARERAWGREPVREWARAKAPALALGPAGAGCRRSRR